MVLTIMKDAYSTEGLLSRPWGGDGIPCWVSWWSYFEGNGPYDGTVFVSSSVCSLPFFTLFFPQTWNQELNFYFLLLSHRGRNHLEKTNSASFTCLQLKLSLPETCGVETSLRVSKLSSGWLLHMPFFWQDACFLGRIDPERPQNLSLFQWSEVRVHVIMNLSLSQDLEALC